MIARAPGKVVLAGAYVVLEGAPAWVAAVDRYVVADSARPAARITPEVKEALSTSLASGGPPPPWFDATALRDVGSDRKLGLGSSAAILVASLAALALARDPQLTDEALAAEVFSPALTAHRAAQGGGSGLDVAASAFGGVLRFRRSTASDVPSIAPRTLPGGLSIAVWSSPEAASTARMLEAVAVLRDRGDGTYAAITTRLRAAAEACDHAATAEGWLAIFGEQLAGLDALGRAAAIPIVTEVMRTFHRAVSDLGAVVFPSGAGGGDVILVASKGPAHPDVERRGRALGLVPLTLALGARGVHAVRSPQPSPSPASSAPTPKLA